MKKERHIQIQFASESEWPIGSEKSLVCETHLSYLPNLLELWTFLIDRKLGKSFPQCRECNLENIHIQLYTWAIAYWCCSVKENRIYDMCLRCQLVFRARCFTGVLFWGSQFAVWMYSSSNFTQQNRVTGTGNKSCHQTVGPLSVLIRIY